MPKLKPNETSPAAVIEMADPIGIKAKREIATSSIPLKKKQRINEYVQNDGVIVLLSDDEDGGHDSDGTVNLCGDDDDDSDDDDEVFIVDPSEATKRTTAINRAAEDNADDEVQAIGEKNVMRLPHMRQHCTKHRFVLDVSSELMEDLQ